MSESRKSYWGGQHRLDNAYGKLVLERVRLDSGGYTSAGRYFGTGKPLYRVMNDSSEDGIVDFYIRAADRKAAIAEVRGMYPQAKIPGGGGGAPKPKRTRPARSASKRAKSSRSKGTKRRVLSRMQRVRLGAARHGWGVLRHASSYPALANVPAGKLYNATAEVTYERQGGWKGSFGLRTLFGFSANSKAQAEKIATEIYEKDPEYLYADKTFDNVRIHLSVEEKY